MAKYTRWSNAPEDMKLFEKVFNDDTQIDRLAILVEAGAPYLYPEQDSEDWKETVIDKFTKMQMVESLEKVSRNHSRDKKTTDEINESFRQHLTHALWIAVEINNELLINALMDNCQSLIWSSTPRNMELFEKVFNDDTQIDRLAILVEAGAPYLYPEQYSRKWKETVIDKFTKLQMYEGLRMVLGMHGKSKVTDEIDYTYKRHIGHAVEIAAETNNMDLVDILLNKHPISVDVFRIAACDGGRRTLEKVLPEDLDQTDDNEYTMLHHAAMAGRGATIKFLLEKGANVDGLIYYNTTTPLMMAGVAETKDEFTLSILIENSDPRRRSIGGGTVLASLVRHGLYQYVPRLIELGCDPNGNGNYHLIEAAKEGHTLTVNKIKISCKYHYILSY